MSETAEPSVERTCPGEPRHASFMRLPAHLSASTILAEMSNATLPEPRSMRPLQRALLIASAAAMLACTTPLPLYGSGNESASTREEASVLMAARVNEILAEKFKGPGASPPTTRKAVFPVGSNASANHGGMDAVLFDVSVGKDGLVKDVKVLESPSQYLSEDVIKAYRQWEFTPLLVDGEARAFGFRLRQPFRMKS